MANLYLPSRFSERVLRLGLGVEAVDALRDARIPFPIAITFDDLPLGLPRPRIRRHDSAAFALLLENGLEEEIAIRLFDVAPRPDDRDPALWNDRIDRRRFVPRRLRISFVSGDGTVTQRMRRPFLFPGATCDISDCATGLRGRVLRGGAPVRWARVHALAPDTNQLVGIAHGDDRGEFLLVIHPDAGGLAELTNPLPLELHVHVPTPPVVDAATKLLDPLWDLPVEQVAEPGTPDLVCPGTPPWAGWTDVATVTIDFTLGTLMRGLAPLTV